ncbi:hypothetical protein D3C78_1344820 [compost metagenome]
MVTVPAWSAVKSRSLPRLALAMALAAAAAEAREISLVKAAPLARAASSSVGVSMVGTDEALPAEASTIIPVGRPPVMASSARIPSQRRLTWS